jgi:hypothetical protein
MAGEIECTAKFWRKDGRWIASIDLPEWVAVEVARDLCKPPGKFSRGLILHLDELLLHLVDASQEPVPASSSPAPVAAPPAAPLFVAPPIPAQMRGPVQVLPAALTGKGKLLVHKPSAKPATGGRNVVAPYAKAEAYIRKCHLDAVEIDFEKLGDITGLASHDDMRRIILRVLSDAADGKHLTSVDALATVADEKERNPLGRRSRTNAPLVAGENTAPSSSLRRGPAPGYKQSQATIDKRKQTLANKRARQTRAEASRDVNTVL